MKQLHRAKSPDLPPRAPVSSCELLAGEEEEEEEAEEEEAEEEEDMAL